MLRLFLDSHWRLLRMAVRSLWPPRGGHGRRSLRHFAVTFAFLLGFYGLFLYQWLGLVLDEILFRGYRSVRVREPLFVLGVPRSGTTFVHEVLADDERFTTFSTWECFFAASVSWRRLWTTLAALDRRVGRPLGRVLRWLERRLGAGLEDTHPLRLGAPEEDFFCLLPVLACFVLVVPFPDSPDLWRMAGFDEEMPPAHRRRLLAFYRGCVQRHLYHHGHGLRFLSKNASFAPLVQGLLETFPDARVVSCVRDPVPTVSSQLSVLFEGLRWFDNLAAPEAFRDRMLERLAFYYRNLAAAGDALSPARWQWITLGEIRAGLGDRVEALYGSFGIPMTDAYRARLVERAAQARSHRSAHRHALADFGLAAEDVQRIFASVYERFGFAAAGGQET